MDWCGRPLPEVVQLTAGREEWRRVVTGFNGSQRPRVKKKIICSSVVSEILIQKSDFLFENSHG